MIRKHISILLILGLFAVSAKAGDWSEWWHRTPGQHEISNQQFGNIHRNLFICRESGPKSAMLQFIGKWYFYKGHIIGTLMPDQPNQFFIINEKTCSLETFTTYSEFEQVLRHKGLMPVIWIRWYNSNWGFFFVGPGYGGPWDFLWFRGTWLLFPLVPFAIVGAITNYSKRNIKFFLGLVFTLFIIFSILLDIHPESI